MTRAAERHLGGDSWAQFCDQLRAAGNEILRPGAPDTALERAEGFRYLTRLLRIALEMHVEGSDPEFPAFIVPSHETAKIGADNPDNLYLSARIDGRHEYRVSGHRGTVASLNFATRKGGYASADGRMEGTGFIDAAHMKFDADGSFELRLNREPRPGNWLPMEEATNQLLVRQTFLDRRSEQPARISIERLDAGARPAPLEPAALHGNLLRAASFVHNTARIFADWTRGFAARPNMLPPADQALCQAAGGDPNIFYYHGYWELADDQALLIEVPRIPPCDYWNFQLNNWWMESLDYRWHRIHVNRHGARLDPDGSLTIVVAAGDPGRPNWLETAGHRRGTMCFRWIGAPEPVHPCTRVVALDGLRGRPA